MLSYRMIVIRSLLAVGFVLAVGSTAAAQDEEGLPLETTRVIEFDTDEGTWMSVDVSPDGTQLVFDLLGDLYLLPIAGGTAQRIAEGPAFDFQPRFSPDGTQIVFVSDRNGTESLWLANADGSDPRVIVTDTSSLVGSPAWSPDGEFLAVRKGVSSLNLNELWLYHKDGGSGIQVTDGDAPMRSVAGPEFSPDGTYIYFSSSAQGHRYNADLGHYQVSRYHRDNGDIETITGNYGGGLRPVLSPDGRTLAYVSRDEAHSTLRIRDLETGSEQQLVYPLDLDEQEGFVCRDLYPGYSFTPDGQAIVISFGGKFHRVDVSSGEATPIPFTAQVRQELAPLVHFERTIETGPVKARQLRWTNQSPDGTRLTFGAVGQAWIMDLPDGSPRRVTERSEREYTPSFSPDGDWIAYVSWTDAEGGHLWKVPAVGGTPIQLTRVPAFYHRPTWAPDGSKIAFVQGAARAWLATDPSDVQQIRWVDAQGGQSHLVVNSPLPPAIRGSVQRLTFSSDGQRIYYLDAEPPPPPSLAYAPGRLVLHSVRLDGADAREHAKLVGAEAAVPSPDGKWVAYTVRGDAYLAPLPRVGEVVTLDLESPAVNIRRLTNEGAGNLRWENSGQTLTWRFGNRFYRSRREDALQATDAQELDPTEFVIDLQVPRPRPQGQIALRNARIVTMRGDEVIPVGDIVVEDKRIAAIGASGSVAIPDNAHAIDVSGKTIVPGFIDMHDHLRLPGEVIPQRSWSLAAHLAYGVTTGFDPSANTKAVFANAEMVEAGRLRGHRIYSTGISLNPRSAKIESLEDARHIARQFSEHGAIFLKEYLQPRRIQRQWLAMAAREEGVSITADGGGDLFFDMTHILDGYTGYEHSMPAVPLYRDVIELLARSQTYYSPTLGVELVGPWGQHYFRQQRNLHDDPKLRRFTPKEVLDRRTHRGLWFRDEDFRVVQVAEQAAKLVHRGGYVVPGGHGEQQGIATHWDIWFLAMGGLSPLEALRAATLSGAERLGLDQDLGSLETGKIADFVVLNGNPLDDIQRTTDILYVMHNGELFEGETLDQIWPERREFGEFYWETEAKELEKRRDSHP